MRGQWLQSSFIKNSLFLVLTVVCVTPGCMEGQAGELDNLSTDANDNGFPEIPPPAGITFDEVGSVNVAVSNEFTRDDAADFLEQIGLDRNLVNIGTLSLEMVITLDYGSGIEDTIEDTETLRPFEKRFEVACPQTATIAVDALASAPFFGEQLVATFRFDLDQGENFNCGDTIEAQTIVDEDGNPDFEVFINP
ncbi:MAG: hypothetical protein DHS20C16_19170 [Phycisphaerae bacterium]|nr:MAG: hypothetical protein DHS20C16_19170 [Phycisphaerae bacterium]